MQEGCGGSGEGWSHQCFNMQRPRGDDGRYDKLW